MAGGVGSGGRVAVRCGGTAVVPGNTRLLGVRRNAVGAVAALSFGLPFALHARYSLLSFSFVISLARTTRSRDRPGQRAKGVLATSCYCADSSEETDCTYPRYDLDRSHASNE